MSTESTADPIEDAINAPLLLRHFDSVVERGLLSGAFSFLPPAVTSVDKMAVALAPDGNSYVIGFTHSRQLPFMEYLLDSPIVLSRLSPLIASIRTLDRSSLVSNLNLVAAMLRREIAITEVIERDLEDVLKKYGHWSVDFYILNYGESAMFIEPKGELKVQTSGLGGVFGGAISFEADVYLNTVKLDGAKSIRSRTPVADGLLVNAGASALISFRSSSSHEGIARAAQLQNLAEDGKSRISVKLRIVSNGFRSRKSVSTKKFVFRVQPLQDAFD